MGVGQFEVAAAQDSKRYTYEDYLRLGGEERYEVLEGELVVAPAPGTKHQLVTGNLLVRLKTFVEGRRLGVVIGAPFDVVLRSDIIVQPDIFYVSKEHFPLLTERCFRGAPSLIVEVLSAASAQQDRVRKSRLYLACGVREYWLVDPETATVEVFVAGKDAWQLSGAYTVGEELHSPLLPDLRLDLDEVFAWPEGWPTKE